MKRNVNFWTALAIFLLCDNASGSTTDATISFTAPTTYTDGTSITAGTAISYAVYQGLQGGTKGKVATITALTTTITSGMVGGNTYCFTVTAVVAGQESAQSNEACKAIAGPTPQAVVITVR